MATVITNKGLALLAKLTQGNTLEITSAKTGAGTVDASLLQQQTAVTNQKQTMTIKSINYPEDGKCALVLSVTNDGVASGYTIMQVGIYAQDPDEGELLFSIWQVDNGSGINIPSEAVLPGYNAEMNYYIKYDQADSVNVNVDPSNTVSQAAMEAYVDKEAKSVVNAHATNKSNPHGVTAAQLNLARVATSGSYNDLSNKPTIPSTLPANGGNADTVDGKHASDFATSGHTHKYAGSSTAGGSATSAEKLAAAKTIQIDLGSESAPGFDGTANVSPGVKGTLPIKHGGTGATTVEQARNNLGIITPDEIANLYIWKKYGETRVNGASIAAGNGSKFIVKYADTVRIKDGKFIADDIKSFDVTGAGDSSLDAIKGKYAILGTDTYVCYRIPTDATFSTTTYGSTPYITASTAYKVGSDAGYAAAKTSDAYPTGGPHTDGYLYEYQKQLCEPEYTYGTEDLEPGVSPLATGKLYIVYE